MVVTTSLPLPPFNIVFLLGVDLTKCHLHLRMVQGDVTTMTINSSSIGAAKLDFMGSEARCVTLDSRKTRIIALAQKLEIPLKSPVLNNTKYLKFRVVDPCLFYMNPRVGGYSQNWWFSDHP